MQMNQSTAKITTEYRVSIETRLRPSQSICDKS